MSRTRHVGAFFILFHFSKMVLPIILNRVASIKESATARSSLAANDTPNAKITKHTRADMIIGIIWRA